MMKGWLFTRTNEPLKLVEKEIPKAKPGYVVIRTGACGICHSDVGTLRDEGWMSIMNLPVIMGHENAGTIIDQTTPNMIQRISGVFERKPLISRGIIAFSKL